MKPDSIGELIASRTLILLRDDNSTSEITVQLGKPQPWPDHNYFCPYQIKGAGDERVGYAAGIDSFQALHLALSILRAEVEALNKQLNGRLRWENDDAGALGFPGFVEEK
jgi:hypothetical protein